MTSFEKTMKDLEDRLGGVYDLDALAVFCGTSSRSLRRTLQEEAVPIITVGRKQLVVRELAERALGLDESEVALEILRNEQAMRRMEYRADGTRKSVEAFAAESSARARAALAQYRAG